MSKVRPPDCHRCAYGTDMPPEPGYDVVTCKAPWAQWVARDSGGSDSLLIPQPFACTQFRRDNGSACGCDRGELHKCERHS